MRKRIWNQLKKAVVMATVAGILGTCAASASELEEAELSEPAVILRQSAEWTDEENFQAELRLEVSGLKELYKQEQKKQEQEKTVPENGEIQEENQNTDTAQEGGTEAEYENAEYKIVEYESAEYETAAESTENESWNEPENKLENESENESGETVPDKEAEESFNVEESGSTEPARYFLTAYISEYFQVNEEGLKHDMQAESVQIQNQKGAETQITKLTCEVMLSDAETDTFILKVPVYLREEYRISPVEVTCPLCQDAPLYKDQDTTGAYFWVKEGEKSQMIAVSSSVLLSVREAKSGIKAELQQETEDVRAGKELTYILTVQNTGVLSLENIEISSSFSINDIKAVWTEEEGFRGNETQGVLACLQAGETRKLRMTVKLTEEQSGELLHTVTVRVKHPGKEESIGCESTVKTNIAALNAAFEVEKTADRTQAYPGDTITYQICIRNTGERTLHSVLSTERFQNAGIQAKFVQKEGVTLNSTGTQAMIPQIAPGEAFALYATVTVPQYLTSQELINEVIVTSDETGVQTKISQANVTLSQPDNPITVTPQPTPAAAVQNYGLESKSGIAYTASSKPRTGDETEAALYIVLGIFAVMSGISAFYHMKVKKRQN